MANERRSEASEPPFWSSAWDKANQGAAWADEMSGGMLSAAAGAVNPVVAPFVNPFLPEGSKLGETYGDVKASQERAFDKLPTDAKAWTQYPGAPGGAIGKLNDAMLVFALPAMERLRKAGLLDKKTADAYADLPKYSYERTPDDIRREWDQGFARTSDFWGSSPERRQSDDLLLYVPSQDFRLQAPLNDGYTTDGTVRDLFHLNPQVETAMPPGLADTRVTLRPNSSLDAADSDGGIHYTFPHLMDPRRRRSLRNFPHPDGRVFYDNDAFVTAHPRMVEDIAGHEILGHGPQLTEVGTPYLKQMTTASNKRLTGDQMDSPMLEALENEYTRISSERRAAETAGDADRFRALDNELQRLNRRIARASEIINYHDLPQERWARWVQNARGMSLDEVRENPPGLDSNFFSSEFTNAMSSRDTGLPFTSAKPYDDAN